MGRVFSWREIEKREIPTLQNFSKAAELTRETLEDCRAISGAVICGSVIYGLHTVRSDIDCVVLYKIHEREDAERVLQHLTVYAKKLHVPLKLIPVDTWSAMKSVHSIHMPFGKSRLLIAARRGGLIKENPVNHLAYSGRDMTREIIDYISFKQDYFEKSSLRLAVMDDDDPFLYNILEKILEAPVHIARDVLVWLLKENEIKDDSKMAVVNTYVRGFGGKSSVILKKIVELDAQYSVELDSQLREKGKEDRARYSKIIRRIREAAPLVWEFAHLNLRRIKGEIL